MGESTKYLLIGGGIASVAAAQAIRERDKEGRIILATADTYMPYDRPPLSKNYLTNVAMTADDAASKFDNFYPDNNIELWRGTEAVSINTKQHTVTFRDGTIVQFEKLLIATGARPNAVETRMDRDERVYLLRNLHQADALRQELEQSKRAMVVGSGYLGIELASSLKARGLEVTMVSKDDYPYQAFASPALGKFVADYLRSQGVEVLLQTRVAAFNRGEAITGDAQRIPMEFAALAIGVTLNLELATNAGIDVDPVNGIFVNEHLMTTEPQIYAAGDVANFRDLTMNKQWHLEHHLNARWQGQCVGANMAEDPQVYDRVPYFFSDFFDLHMVLRGDPEAPNNTTVIGDMADAEFIELYCDESGTVRMGVGVSRDEKKLDAIADKLEELIRAKAKARDLSLLSFSA